MSVLYIAVLMGSIPTNNHQFMFTVEIKINGSLIGHIYGHNEGDLPNGESKYRYEYYETESRKVVNGNVTHKRHHGIRQLVNAILTDVDKTAKKTLKSVSPVLCPNCAEPWDMTTKRCALCGYPGK